MSTPNAYPDRSSRARFYGCLRSLRAHQKQPDRGFISSIHATGHHAQLAYRTNVFDYRILFDLVYADDSGRLLLPDWA